MLLLNKLKKLHAETSYSLIIKNSNMFQYSSEEYQKLLKIARFIQLIENKVITLEQEHFILSLFNMNKTPYIKYPKFINV